MKKTIGLLLAASLFAMAFCSKGGDISGTYKKVMGDYRYDTILIEKAGGNKYTVTIMEHDQKKLQAVSELNGDTIQMGWLAPITVKKGSSELVLNIRNGTLFRKVGR